MTDLPYSELHVWLANFEDFISASDCDFSILSRAEHNHVEKLHSTEQRQRNLLSKALVRSVLAGYLQIEAKDIRFLFNAYGKPFLDHSTDLQFNYSHARNLLLIAVRRGKAVGADLEYVHFLTDLQGIAAAVFAPRELVAISTAPLDERTEVFFRTWVQKEAYIKALGVGFSAPTTAIDTDTRSTHVSFDPTGAMLWPHEVKDWLCWTFEPHHGFLAAIVTHSANLTLRQFVLTPHSLRSLI